MPIRCAISQASKGFAALFLILSLAIPGQARSGDRTELTLDQARELSVRALHAGDAALAIRVALGLLQADPDDPMAHYVLALAYSGIGEPGAARKAAARAYRLSDPGPDRFHTAELAARMAFAEDRLSLAQLWLRRTAIHVESADDKELLARDYKILRRLNPWAFRLQTDLRPSSNVNNGADTALQIIDGVPVTGALSGAAQALSGVIASADLALSYRLRADDQSATSLVGRIYAQRVALSDEAKELAPEATGSDFASTFAEVSLSHGFRSGENGVATADFTLGESWWGGERSYRLARIGGEHGWQLTNGAWLKVHGLAETRSKARYAVNDARILGVGARYQKTLANGDDLSLSAAWRDTQAQDSNGTFNSISARLGYKFDQSIGPGRLGLALVLGHSHYPVYQSGFFMVPGGRTDKSVYGDLNFFFDKYDYAGFAPMLRLRSGRKQSNDSRFDTRELTMSLGIESKF